MGIISKIFGTYNDRELKRVDKIVDIIESLEQDFKSKTDEELKACTVDFKQRIADGESLDSILPEAFAAVREASSRVLGMRHFRVQLVGGVVLHAGRIAEMRTGEGKTLVATLPAYLNALSGRGMHIVTVNEYLAKRDAEWMGKIYKFLGMTVGVNLNSMTPEQKKQAYACDIMYSTNNELGFDYLRDNMATSKERLVQRELAFAIVDEVDSILIDEARTPLIISGRSEKSSDNYILANRFVKTLQPEDYELSLKDKTVYLNENGAIKAEEYFKISNLADYENQELKHYIDNALKAHKLMKKEDNYLVVDNEIIIIDEYTGRQMIGRRYSNGLHQAIEAKENVPVRAENKTLATITFQNFFRLYEKLSGMTGTAKTEENEFESIYKLDVVVIPTNKPIARTDENDQLYTTRAAKLDAVVKEIEKSYEKKQPVLVGTISVEKSEELAKILSRKKIKHNVLNAKNHQLEAEIIAQAGKSGAVTIATNMAGRGTDILLGGNPEFLAKQKMKNEGYPDDIIELANSFEKSDDPQIEKAKAEYCKYLELFKQNTNKEKEQVIAAGGLKIIGTERHDSRRIDNQLRGRSGRQGDIGSSIFYLSMEDDLIREFGGDRMFMIAQKLSLDPDQPISAKIITSMIESAQARVEDRNLSIRKNVLRYDDVMNVQRKTIYNQRRLVLDGMNVHEQVLAMIKDSVGEIIKKYVDYDVDHREWDYKSLNGELESCVLENGTNYVHPDLILQHELIEDLTEDVSKVAIEQYEAKNKYVSEELGVDFAKFERDCLLYHVDNKWMEHIGNMDELRQGISLVAYAQQDPVLVYKRDGFNMFEEMSVQIARDTVKWLCKAKIEKTTNTASKEKTQTQTNQIQTIVKKKSVGRNEPCPCGSRKKYKNCCGLNE